MQDPGAGGLENSVERGGEIRSAVADQELNVLETLAEGEVAGLLHGPLARRARGDPADVHPAGAMFDEHQHVYALQQHGVHMQEVDCDDPGGLGVQELPPARARAPRCRIDARSMQDLPHGGRRDSHAELREFAVDPAVSPQRILPRQADDKACDGPPPRRREPPQRLRRPPLRRPPRVSRQVRAAGRRSRARGFDRLVSGHVVSFAPARACPRREVPRQVRSPGVGCPRVPKKVEGGVGAKRPARIRARATLAPHV